MKKLFLYVLKTVGWASAARSTCWKSACRAGCSERREEPGGTSLQRELERNRNDEERMWCK